MITEKESIKVSVIIIAYQRREFIIQAVKSAINQDLDKKEYEIIVVKNFADINIDQFLHTNGIKSVLSHDTSIGSKFVEGIKMSKGEIICLLEDDDIFQPDKLSKVRSFFLKYPKLCYYHNNASFIDEDGDVIHNFDTISTRKLKGLGEIYIKDEEKNKNVFKLFNIGSYWNNSCICIRKKFYLDFMATLSKIKSFFDGALFFGALFSDGDILIGGDTLTHYRINVSSATQKAKHNNVSHFNIAKTNTDDNLSITQMVEHDLENKSRIFERLMVDRACWELKTVLYNISSTRIDGIKYFYYMITKYRVTIQFIRSNLLQLSGLLLFIISPGMSKKMALA